jgi:tetratricopeptide (TPR) repeat protein
VLRTAQSLVAANVPQRRITRSMRELRAKLPESMPMSGLSIRAEGDRVVVREGRRRWQAESGQYLLDFGGDPEKGRLRVVEQTPEVETEVEVEEGLDWYVQAVAIEPDDAKAAVEAYGRAIAADPSHLDARLNLGRLLHEQGRLREAEKVYRAAPKASPLLLYNLGVLLDDLGRKAEAIRIYEGAVRADPSLADAHYNLALLYEQQGKGRDAIRHMAHYRRLAATK